MSTVPPPERFRAVIFDWGGVVSTSPIASFIEYAKGIGLGEAELFRLFAAEYASPEGGEAERAWHLLETGRLTLEEYVGWIAAQSHELIGAPLDPAFGDFATMGPRTIHWMVVHRIRELREAGYRTSLLTNNVREWEPHWRATTPCDELFDDVVDSSAVGLRKPDPAIYRLACERLGVAPTDVVFLDDFAANVEAARALGMGGVVVGDDPWEALEELDRLLAGTSVALDP